MTTVLNPALFARLERCFGSVKVANPGVAMRYRAIRNPLTKEPMLDIPQRGEQYRINCCYCNDTRFRLYVSCMWGKEDSFGRRMTFLMKCHNEDCLSRQENRDDFIDRMEAIGGPLEGARIRPGVRVPDEAPEVKWPGTVIPLDKLPQSHEARHYLISRGFDPDKMSKEYDVRYCEDSVYYICRGRLIIPIWEHDKLKGWQARYVGELPWKDPEKRHNLPPKYFSCPGSQFRSRCLYNFDHMRQWQTGIIVEGPTDVWRFGPMAGCIFGNTMTDFQRRKFLAVFRKHTAVLLLDPEEFEEASTRRLVRTLTRAMPGRFCAVKLPEGTDPGSLDRKFLRTYVAEQAKVQGVTVRYTKRDA